LNANVPSTGNDNWDDDSQVAAKDCWMVINLRTVLKRDGRRKQDIKWKRVTKGIRIFYVSCSGNRNILIYFLLVLTKKKMKGAMVVVRKLKQKKY